MADIINLADVARQAEQRRAERAQLLRDVLLAIVAADDPRARERLVAIVADEVGVVIR